MEAPASRGGSALSSLRASLPPARTLVALLALSLVAGYQLALVEVLRQLPYPEIAAPMLKGFGAGWPAVVFLGVWLPFSLGAAVLSIAAASGPDVEGNPLRATALRRGAFVLAPLFASPWIVLVQEHVLRRSPLYGLCVGVACALAAYFATGDDASDRAAETELPPLFAGWRAHAPVLALMAAHFAALAYLTVTRDRALWSATVDLGLFKEALWNTTHGGGVLYSPTVGYSFLGEHFSPVLFLLVPFYALWPSSATLLIAQTLAITLAAWPLYRLSYRLGLGRALATVLAGSMLFAPAMQSAQLYDFHMDLLGVPALMWALCAAYEKRWGVLTLAAMFLCTVKEDAFVPITGLTLALAFTEPKQRKPAAALLFATLLYCGLAIAVFLKKFGPPPGVPVYMSSGPEQGYKFFRNFRHFGHNNELSWPWERPGYFVLWAITDGRLTAMVSFFAPVLFMPFLSGRRALVMSPFAVQLLTDNPEIVDLAYHYPAMQHPGVYAAGAYGMHELAKRLDARARGTALRRALVAGAVSSMVVMVFTHPRSSFSGMSPHPIRRVTDRVRALDARLYSRVPPNVPVSATSFGGPRLSNRREIHLFPRGIDTAQYVLVDMQRPPWPASAESRDSTLWSLLGDRRWGVVDFVDGAVLLSRGADRARNREAARALFLRRTYEAEGLEQTEFPAAESWEAGASDGVARVVRPTDRRRAGFVLYGPFVRQPTGRWRVLFRMRAVPTVFGTRAATIDVFSEGRTVAQRTLSTSDLPDGEWAEEALEFASYGNAIFEFRVKALKEATLMVDRVRLEPADAAEEEQMLQNMGL